MVKPFFFVDDLNGKTIMLDEDTSKHMILVLRMKKGNEVLLTDGKGKMATAVIVDDNRKRCVVGISSTEMSERKGGLVAIGISLIKNAARFEWFLEKATEIGVSEIIPLICERTEREKFRPDRMQNILVSAMLQSQQCWLPVLHEPTKLNKVVQLGFDEKFVAYCDNSPGQLLRNHFSGDGKSQIVLIGPEGDFTTDEISMATSHQFIPVSLGHTRLRTETAGLVAAVSLVHL